MGYAFKGFIKLASDITNKEHLVQKVGLTHTFLLINLRAKNKL